ncbi:MAG: hypothetical protein IH943_04600 [Acidobacteria bacterium]|nr:hypothetical protein [Acidobacteriota bacterium]
MRTGPEARADWVTEPLVERHSEETTAGGHLPVTAALVAAIGVLLLIQPGLGIHWP